MLRLTARGILINRNTGRVLLIKYLDKHSKLNMEFTDGFWVPNNNAKYNEAYKKYLRMEN